MINLEPIFKINNRNDYFYIFDKYYGNGYFNSHSDGYGFGSGFTFGNFKGNGRSNSFKILIKNYKTI